MMLAFFILNFCIANFQVVTLFKGFDNSIFASRIAKIQNSASYTIPLGKTITAAPSQLTIQYRSLVADSRCPTGVQCVWQGDAQVVLAIAGQDYTFHTTLDPQSHIIGRYRVRLIQVEPYPSLNPQSISRSAFVTVAIE